MLQSGEDAYFTRDIMCKIITGIKNLDAALTLSIGERSYEEYSAFKDAGADRFLLRIETTDKKLYEAIFFSGFISEFKKLFVLRIVF